MLLKFLSFAFVVTIFGCSTDDRDFYPYPLDPNQPKFYGDLVVEIVGESGEAAQDVEIRYGVFRQMTNEFGVAFFRNIPLVESSFITASKEGYFQGSRMIFPATGNAQFAKIKLLSKGSPHEFIASDGVHLELSSGLKFYFDKNAIARDNGTDYNGKVSLSVQLIPANDPDLSVKMPGALVGKSLVGTMGSLASFGMVAAEIRSEDGELLKIKDGADVEIHIPVPSDIVGNAPTVIPMWYFNEIEGIWVEEGLAVLSGDSYIAHVSHFSFWNCDDWFPTVKWETTILAENGLPVTQSKVCLTIISLNTTACSYTDFKGVVKGMVALDEAMEMSIYSSCEQVIHTVTLDPVTGETHMQPVIIPFSVLKPLMIHGQAMDCTGKPVVDGYVLMQTEGHSSYHMLSAESGEFSGISMNCVNDSVSLMVFNNKASTRSVTMGFLPKIEEDELDAGTISVCEGLEEYMHIQVIGLTPLFNYPLPRARRIENYTEIFLNESEVQNFPSFNLIVTAGTPVGFTLCYSGFKDYEDILIRIPSGEEARVRGLNWKITYHGDVGDYIKGEGIGFINVFTPGKWDFKYPVKINFSLVIR